METAEFGGPGGFTSPIQSSLSTRLINWDTFKILL